MTTTQENTEKRVPKGTSHPVAPLLLVLMAIFLLTVTGAMLSGVHLSHAFAGLCLGVIAAEITLCAVFAALTPFSLSLRMGLGLAGAVVVCVAIFRMDGPGGDERLEIAGAAFLQWIAVQIPLWVFRLRGGWLLRWTPSIEAGARSRDLQFGIRQMMVWTAMVAVVLSIAKTALPADSHSPSGNKAGEILIVTLILVTSNTLAAWPMIWAAFVRSRVFTWCLTAAGCSAILCVGEVWAFRAVFGGVSSEIFALLHLIQFVSVGGSLLLIRASGVRLVPGAHDSGAIGGEASCR